MKKVIILTAIMAMTCLGGVAQEQATQTQVAKDVKGAIVIKKQPTQEQATQFQKAEKIYGSIVIFVQGKTPFDKTDN